MSNQYIFNKDIDFVIKQYRTCTELNPDFFEEKIWKILKQFIYVNIDYLQSLNPNQISYNIQDIKNKIKDIFYNIIEDIEIQIDNMIKDLNVSGNIFYQYIDYYSEFNFNENKSLENIPELFVLIYPRASNLLYDYLDLFYSLGDIEIEINKNREIILSITSGDGEIFMEEIILPIIEEVKKFLRDCRTLKDEY